MEQNRPRLFPRVSPWEIIAILFILLILAAILFPIFTRPHQSRRNLPCASRMKMIGIALIAYSQDNDEHFPPAVGQVHLSDGSLHEQQWGISTSAIVAGKPVPIPGIISGYITTQFKNVNLFQCPSVENPISGLTYLYSDLAAKVRGEEMLHPSNSILIAESEDHLRNVGHARSQSSEGDAAVLLPLQEKQAPKLLVGAAIGDAVMRHPPGANYGFADGHVKWMKPDAVFFPPRTSTSSSHREVSTARLLGPDPNGKMTYQGKTYTATFHLR